MEVSFARVSERLCTRIEWDMASLRGREEPEKKMGRDSSYIEYFNEPLIHGFSQGTETIVSAHSDSLGFCREQSSDHVFRSVEEFRSMLFAHSEPVDAEKVLALSNGGEIGALMKSDGDGADDEVKQNVSEPAMSTTISLVAMDVVCKLQQIATDMAKEGFGAECFHAFVSIRKAVLEDTLSNLGMQKMSMEEVQRMAWEDMAAKISKWIRAFKAAIKVLYASEKMLCDQVFSCADAEESFVQITKESFIRFMNFAEGVVISRRSPERLMKVLDMYEAMCEVLPWIDSVFCDEASVCVREEANRAMARLGEAARGILSELENAIRRDPSKTAIASASIHPLTRYVMNYIRLLVCYMTPLSRLLGEARINVRDASNREDQTTTTITERLSPLGVELAWLIVLLEYNLDSKSKLYKDIAQSHFFLMNNAHYIVQKVRKSEELVSLLSEGWIRKQVDTVRVHAMNYRRCGWRKVLGFLREESGGIRVAERLKGFNGSFEDVCRAQASWMVPDPELCEELRVSITENIISAYRDFLAMNHGHLESRKVKDKYLRYTEEDLERSLLQLFEGRKPSSAIA